jgi:hypothetical protein
VTELEISRAIENLLVARNLRGMQQVQPALEPGYFLRAARYLRDIHGPILIGTGFPVLDTFETDGPVGAIALYNALKCCGAEPVIVCGKPLSEALRGDYAVQEISVGKTPDNRTQSAKLLAQYQPVAIISIERPGLTAQGRYCNMRGEDITARCARFDEFVELSDCPTIGIGDGGNEIGMGNALDSLSQLDIIPSVTRCDELLVSDVSNWAAYGLIAIIGYWQGEDLLGRISPRAILGYLSARGSVDGVSRENTLTEDGLPLTEGEQVLTELRTLTGFGETL